MARNGRRGGGRARDSRTCARDECGHEREAHVYIEQTGTIVCKECPCWGFV